VAECLFLAPHHSREPRSIHAKELIIFSPEMYQQILFYFFFYHVLLSISATSITFHLANLVIVAFFISPLWSLRAAFTSWFSFLKKGTFQLQLFLLMLPSFHDPLRNFADSVDLSGSGARKT